MTIAQYLSWYDEVLAPTEPMIRLVPSEKLDWKLTGTSFTLGQLIAHIPGSLLFNGKVMGGEEWPMKSMREILVSNRHQQSATVEESVSLLHDAQGRFRNAVLAIGDERFQLGEIDTPQRGRMFIWHFALFVLRHHTYHLEELHLNLKVLGIKVHTGTLYRGR